MTHEQAPELLQMLGLRFPTLLALDFLENAEREVYVVELTTLRFLYVNPAACANTGYTYTEMMTMGPRNLVPLERRHIFAERITALKSESEMIATETVHVRKDGTTYPVGLRVFRSTLNGAPILVATAEDLSLRDSTEAALRTWRNRLELALAAADIAIWDDDRVAGVTTLSAGLQHVDLPTGVPLQYRVWREYVHPDDFAGVAVRWADLLEGKTALYESVLRLRSTDGGWRWVRSTARVTEYDEAGKPTRITGSYIDVTEQYESERALRESQERLDLAITGGALAVWDSDCVALTTIQDSRFAEFVKRPLVGKMADWDWMQYVHPDDYPRLRANAKAHVRGESESYECEFRILDGHGHWRWLRSRGRVVERADDGTALRAVGTYVDFTDQMRASEALAASEADLSAIFESAGMGIILLSPEMEVLRSNALAKRNSSRIFGMPIEDMRSIVDQLPGSAGEWLERAVAEVIQAGEGRRIETDILAKGGPIPYEFDFAPIRMADGSLRGVGLFSRDISKRKADEALLQQSQKLDSLGRMVAGIAHDFNNLLSAILGYSELAAASLPEGSSARVDIDEAVNAARSASDLTRQLLAFARKQHTEPRDVDINDVLTRTERLVARLMGDDVKVTYARAETPLFVHIDPGQFEQVIVNLAVNARDAIEQGGRVRISTAMAMHGEGPSPYALVEVSDTGSGMSEETIARVFEPFFTTKEEGRGTGLGLATCHGIVTQAGGEIRVESEIGKGTTFRVHLPLLARQAAERSTLEIADDGEVPVGCGETILVIEDQKQVREMVVRTLVRDGYHVLAADGPGQALDIVQEHADLDLIVSDVVMPVLNGVSLAEVLRSELGSTPILFMSAYPDATGLDEILEQDDTEFLAKPFTAAELGQRVRTMLAGRQ